METDTNSILDILPTETIIEILSYLDYDDIKIARFICKSFEQILEKPFINRSCLKLDYRKKFKLDPTNESCNIVYKTNKRFKHILFNEYKFDAAPNPNITEFWNLYYDSIVTLRLKYCSISEEQLLELLPRLKNLKVLEFVGRNSLNAAKVIACLISTVETLTFTSSITVSRDVIEKIPKNVVPTITELNLQYIGSNDEDENYTFRNSGVFAVLKRLSGSLRTFSYFNINDDLDLIQGLNEIDLKLESLKFTTAEEINDADFEKFTKLMCGLKHLSINATCLTDDHAKMICDNMPDLRTLKYGECNMLGNKGISYAGNSKHLETFEVDEYQKSSNKAITEGIAKQLNPTMKDLKLSGSFSNDTYIAVTTNLPNLQSLTLRTYIYFSMELLSLIFNRLRDLRELHVSSINFASDRDEFEPHEVEENLTPPPIPRNVDIRCLTKLKSFTIFGYRDFPGISLDKLAEITELQFMSYSFYMKISKKDVLKVLKSCTKLKKIVFRDCNDFAKSDEDKHEIRNAYPSKAFVFEVDFTDF